MNLEKVSQVLVIFLLFSIGMAATGVIAYRMMLPEKRIKYQYETIPQYDLGRLVNGDHVKFGDVNMCVSSVYGENIKHKGVIEINLRADGECL